MDEIEEKENPDSEINELPVLEAESRLGEQEKTKNPKRAKIKHFFKRIFSIRDDMDSLDNIRERMIAGSKIT